MDKFFKISERGSTIKTEIMADGKTRIEQENLIERGYENLVSRVSEIGIRAKKCL